MKQYRVLYNQDCTNLFAVTKEPLTPAHVDTMVDEVADGGADVMLINPNAQRVCYPSAVWQTFWDGYAPGRREFFGPVQESEIAGREAWVVQMKRLADQGCDYLARALRRCRAKGIAPGVTVRMNDMHDQPWPGTHLYSRFYMEHPEWHLKNPPACGWSATGFNYEHAGVREHYLALIAELVARYDFDVLELDFLRFHCYFPRNEFERHCAIMTGFLRDVRARLAAAPRRIALLARVAATTASAYELGFDVAAWAREGLVDGVSAGAFLNTQWQIDPQEFRRQVGGGVAVYACTDYTADRRHGLAVRTMPLDPALLRGFAAAQRAAGADGVEFFNLFCAREEAWQANVQAPCFGVLRELRDAVSLRGRSKTYTLTSGWANAETDGPHQVPVTLETAQPHPFCMMLAAEPAGTGIEVSAWLSGGDVVADQLWLQLNGTPVGPARSVTPAGASAVAGPEAAPLRAAFAVPASALRDGCNDLLLRNEGPARTLLSLDVSVSPA
jgi:hypothetical protein